MPRLRTLPEETAPVSTDQIPVEDENTGPLQRMSLATLRAHMLDNPTAGSVLFVGAGGVLAQDNAFVWDNTSKRLQVIEGGGSDTYPGSTDITLQVRRTVTSESVQDNWGIVSEYRVDLPSDGQLGRNRTAIVALAQTGVGSTMNLPAVDLGLGGVLSTVVHQGSGLLEEVSAFRSRLQFNGVAATGTVDNFYGFQARDPRNRNDGSGLGSGTVDVNHGVWVEKQTFGTLNYGVWIGGADPGYALYVASGISKFLGPVEVDVGSTSPPGILVSGQGVSSFPSIVSRMADGNSTDSGLFAFDRALGTLDSPAAVGNANTLGVMLARGYDGSDYDDGPQIRFITTQAWTDTVHGAQIAFDVVKHNDTTVQEALRLRYPANSDEAGMLVARNSGGTVTVQAVTQGAVDSGGSGFRVLRVPN